MKVPKDHKLVRRGPLYLEGTTYDAIETIKREADDLVNPRVVEDFVEYDGGVNNVEGWVPMTEAEKAKAKKERAQAREAKKRRKQEIEEREVKLLAELKKKYPDR